jgi:hypothetical protein
LQKFFAKIFVFAKVNSKIFVFAKVFMKVFAKIFYLECGSGFRSHLNVYPVPKHWFKTIPGTKILCENFRENEKFLGNFRVNENFCETVAKTFVFAKNFAKMKAKLFVKRNFMKSERIFAYFCFSRI